MEIRVLRYFLAVVREESITKAADLLHITQPTLSRQIAQMEEEMGVKLFDRGTRKIVLTNEGLLLRRRAEEIRPRRSAPEARPYPKRETCSCHIPPVRSENMRR